MKQAITTAIEKGGFRKPETWKGFNLVEQKLIMLDPLFWQALGRALGETQKQADKIRKGEEATGYHIIEKPWWQVTAVRYFELNLTGGDEEKFWRELLIPTNKY